MEVVSEHSVRIRFVNKREEVRGEDEGNYITED
jgi:hypothetical protein